jgi:hypothetical protein
MDSWWFGGRALSQGLGVMAQLRIYLIVHTFSCWLYGIRTYKSQIKQDYPEYTHHKPDICQ